MNKTIILVILCFTLIVSCTKASQITNNEQIFDDPTLNLLDPNNWPESCNKLKVHYEKEKRLYITYTNKPKKEVSNFVWIINWQGIDIPVPIAAYNHFGATKGDDKTIRSFGISNDEITIFLSSPSKYTQPLYEAEEYNKHIFSTTSYWETMKKQYTVTPDDLSCKQDSLDKDYAIAMILAYKGLIAPYGDVVNVYDDLGKYDGWLSQAFRDNNIFWHAEIAISEKPKGAHVIVYRTSANSKLNDIGLYFGSDLGDNIKPAPQWLELLNKALKTDDSNDWTDFLSSAKRSGFKKDTLDKFAKENGLYDSGP